MSLPVTPATEAATRAIHDAHRIANQRRNDTRDLTDLAIIRRDAALSRCSCGSWVYGNLPCQACAAVLARTTRDVA